MFVFDWIEWFTDTHPKKTPYFPQMGDEVVYFRQGHQHYIDKIRDTKMYSISPILKPYRMRGSQSDEVFAKIIDIKYDVKPPRLVTLKLSVIDRETNEQTNAHFSVRYHDVENVVDFIILRQLYDLSVSREWKVGDQFQSIIDDKWWFGTIESLKESTPFSYFQCFDVLWANGDIELLSPWDLEPINEHNLPQNRSESVPITHEDRLALNLFKEEEWPECGKPDECLRIVNGLVRIMEFAQAEDFAAPVDLNKHPVYGMMISYPMDLSTIKSRVENHFYRRVEAIKFDIKFIELNAQHFNEPGSEIVKKAKIVCALTTRFIEDEQCYDPMPIYLDIISHSDDFDDPLPTEDSKDDDRDEEYREVRRSSRRKRRVSFQI
jgi:bromodomain and WD repeat domain-containing protein 1/3